MRRYYFKADDYRLVRYWACESGSGLRYDKPDEDTEYVLADQAESEIAKLYREIAHLHAKLRQVTEDAMHNTGLLMERDYDLYVDAATAIEDFSGTQQIEKGVSDE